MSKRLLVPFVTTLVLMWIVPIPVYGAFSGLGLLDPAASAPLGQFLLGVTVIKAGFAFGFVAFYDLARPSVQDRWFAYAAVWWVMFLLLELGQVVMPSGNTLPFAVAGVISEGVYFPLAARAVARQLRASPAQSIAAGG